MSLRPCVDKADFGSDFSGSRVKSENGAEVGDDRDTEVRSAANAARLEFGGEDKADGIGTPITPLTRD